MEIVFNIKWHVCLFCGAFLAVSVAGILGFYNRYEYEAYIIDLPLDSCEPLQDLSG